MMKLKTALLLSFGLVLVLSGTLWCQDYKTYNDVIFTKQPGEEGVYSKTIGNIIDLTQSDLMMEIDDKHLLYMRDVVKRIELDKTREDDYKKLVRISEAIHKGLYLRSQKRIKSVKLYEKPVDDYQILVDKIEEIQEGRLRLPEEVVRRIEQDKKRAENYQEYVDVYWNKKKSLIVVTVQQTPGIGPLLSFLDNLPGASGAFLAVLILLAIFFYAAYKLYEMFVVTTNSRNLNSTKLNMEVRKLRYEIEGIEKKLGIPARSASDMAAMQEIDKESIPYSLELPKIHIVDFFKYKVFRILTEEEKQRRTDLWQKKWQSYKKRPAWLRVLFYYTRLSMNLLATILVAMFSIGAFVDIILPFVYPGFASPLVSLIFFLSFVVSFAFLLRLNSQRRIMRKTYREAST